MGHCESCWWFWTGLAVPECHSEEANEEDRDNHGFGCPWYEPKSVLNEQEEPQDIWN
jgi:hypothetical protein